MTKNRWTVLIIEDEKTIGNYIEAILANKDYRTLRAADGVTGLSLYASHHPEVVLLDLGLPDMDGMEVLKKIREFSSVPVIVISARIQEREKVDALDGGGRMITLPSRLGRKSCWPGSALPCATACIWGNPGCKSPCTRGTAW